MHNKQCIILTCVTLTGWKGRYNTNFIIIWSYYIKKRKTMIKNVCTIKQYIILMCVHTYRLKTLDTIRMSS